MSELEIHLHRIFTSFGFILNFSDFQIDSTFKFFEKFKRLVGKKKLIEFVFEIIHTILGEVRDVRDSETDTD